MKSPLLLLISILFTGATATGQENFKVIKVNGTILLKSKGVSLETGTVFSDRDALIFRTEDASAAVINPQKGRVVLTSKNHDLSSTSSNYLPAMYNISTRGGSLSNLIELQNHFSRNYVILESERVVIDPEGFPMDKDNFFFLRYLYKGEEINKKLPFSGDTLFIDKSTLYSVDGKQIPGPDNNSVKMFYKQGKEIVMINQFNLIFPDVKQLKEEVKVILDTRKDLPPKDRIAEVNGYIFEQYGKVCQTCLLTWLERNFGLRSE